MQQKCENGRCRQTWSTGTVIGRDSNGRLAILSCAHGAQAGVPYLVEIDKGNGFEEAQLKSIDPDGDLSLLLVNHSERTACIPVGDVQPQAGEVVNAGGWALAKHQSARQTKVKRNDVDTFDVAETFSQGESGGPAVFNDQLVGVIRGNDLPTFANGVAPLNTVSDGTLTCLSRIRRFVRGGLGGIPEAKGAKRQAAGSPQSQPQSSRNPAPGGTPLQPTPHPGPLPKPVIDDMPGDAAAPAPSAPAVTPDLLKNLLDKAVADMKGHTTGEVAGAKTHTTNEADRLGTLATGGLSNAKDSILSKLKDPATAEEIAKKLGSPDAAAIAEKVLAGIPKVAPIIEGGASVLGISSIATGVGAPLGIAVLIAQLLGSWMHSRAIGKLGQKATPPPNGNGSSQPQPPSPPASAGASTTAPAKMSDQQIVQVQVADPKGDAIEQATIAILKKNQGISLLDAQPAIHELAQTILNIRRPFTIQPASTGAIS